MEPRVEALLKADPGVKLIPREFIIEPGGMIAHRGHGRRWPPSRQDKYCGLLPDHDVDARPSLADSACVRDRPERGAGYGPAAQRIWRSPRIYAQIITNFNLARATRIFQTPTFIIGDHIVTEPSAQIDFPALVAKARAAYRSAARGAVHLVDEKDPVIDAADIGDGVGLEFRDARGGDGGPARRAQVHEGVWRVQRMQPRLRLSSGAGAMGVAGPPTAKPSSPVNAVMPMV